MLLKHIGKITDGLAGYRPRVVGAGTVLACEFLYLDFGFYNWFELFFCMLELGFLHFYILGWYPSFFMIDDESGASTHVL